MIRVLVADDQALVRAGITGLLAVVDGVEVVGAAADGAEAVRLARRLGPDVVLMDVRMPHVDGIEATRRILAERPATRVVVLTTFADDGYVFAALRAGALGYLVKDDEPETLVDGVRRAHAGQPVFAPGVLARVVARAVDAPDERPPPGDTAGLTGREREVLALVAAGLSNAEIGRRLHLGTTTVKSHVSAAIAKLGAPNRVAAAVAAYRLGLVPPGG